MSCYSPILARYKRKLSDDSYVLTKNGKKAIEICGNFSDKNPLYLELLKSGDLFTIPCGKCIGCKLDYSRHWADRMVLEYEHCKKAVFVTLTYADPFLPPLSDPDTGEVILKYNEVNTPVAPLRKYDMSEFMKSLRSKFKDNGYDIKVRFYGCGEYGSLRHRPHLHIILFGVDLNDLQSIVFSGNIRSGLVPWVSNELGQISYRSNLLEDVWKKGIVSVSEVSYETMAYVARYSLKKAQGDSYAKKYNIPEEFTLMSRMPGIGAPFLDSHPDILSEVSTWYVKGKEIYWPKYLLEKYFSSPGDIEVFDNGICVHYYKGEPLPQLESLKLKRKEIAINNFTNTFEFDERPYYEKQEFLRKQKEFSIRKLSRGDAAMV